MRSRPLASLHAEGEGSVQSNTPIIHGTAQAPAIGAPVARSRTVATIVATGRSRSATVVVRPPVTGAVTAPSRYRPSGALTSMGWAP